MVGLPLTEDEITPQAGGLRLEQEALSGSWAAPLCAWIILLVLSWSHWYLLPNQAMHSSHHLLREGMFLSICQGCCLYTSWCSAQDENIFNFTSFQAMHNPVHLNQVILQSSQVWLHRGPWHHLNHSGNFSLYTLQEIHIYCTQYSGEDAPGTCTNWWYMFCFCLPNIQLAFFTILLIVMHKFWSWTFLSSFPLSRQRWQSPSSCQEKWY